MKPLYLKQWLKNGKEIFLDFCSTSSIHGVKYFGRPCRSWCEKFWWVALFFFSVCSCALLIKKVYDRWDQSPVIVSVDEKFTPVWEIPFPAVTICPESKATVSRINFTKQFTEFVELTNGKKHLEGSIDLLLAMVQLCDRTNIFDKVNDAASLPNKTTDNSYASLIKALSIPVAELLDHCVFLTAKWNCSKMFSYSITEEGLCVTFNGLSAQEMLRTEILQSVDPYLMEETKASHWSMESGYSREAHIMSYPRRTLGPGFSAGLSLFLRSDLTNHDYLCRGPIHGFKVLLHSSSEYPQVSNKFIRIPMNHDVTIAVRPEMIATTEGLRSYVPKRRQCFFNHERHLKLFRVYTQENCELECLTNFTLQRCGCVKFSMPRTNTTPECEVNQFRCMWNAEIELLLMGPTGHHFEESSFRAQCNCLPACRSVQYDTEITMVRFDWATSSRIRNMSSTDGNGLERSRLEIYYKESQFRALKRSEMFGLTDFLANCGGILGLCMGMSLLSLAELFYFGIIRPFALWERKGLTPRRVRHQEVQTDIDCMSY